MIIGIVAGSPSSGSGPGPDPGADAHKYWRLWVSETSSRDSYFVAANTLELRSVVGGPSVAVGGTASQSSAYPGQEAANLFDGDDDTAWTSAHTAVGPQWAQYEFASAVEIVQMRMVAGDTSARRARAPKDFKLQYSDDGSTWADAVSYSDEAAWSATESRIFLV